MKILVMKLRRRGTVTSLINQRVKMAAHGFRSSSRIFSPHRHPAQGILLVPVLVCPVDRLLKRRLREALSF